MSVKQWLLLAAYETLTQAIVLLGEVRLAVARRSADPRWFPPGRVFRVHWPMDAFECCDCGLTHTQQLSTDDVDDGYGGWMWPERPKGYGYRLRVGAGAPDTWEPPDDAG